MPIHPSKAHNFWFHPLSHLHPVTAGAVITEQKLGVHLFSVLNLVWLFTLVQINAMS